MAGESLNVLVSLGQNYFPPDISCISKMMWQNYGASFFNLYAICSFEGDEDVTVGLLGCNALRKNTLSPSSGPNYYPQNCSFRLKIVAAKVRNSSFI
jgi:hypothetical protein